MWWFTLIFGLFGFHHLLFRSPHTWLLFIVVNTLTFGYWWIFDLIQLSNAGGIDLDIYGLESPWGPLGIAQGMFTEWAKPVADLLQHDDRERQVRLAFAGRAAPMPSMPSAAPMPSAPSMPVVAQMMSPVMMPPVVPPSASQMMGAPSPAAQIKIIRTVKPA